MCSYLQVFFCCVKPILGPSFDLHSLLSFSLFFLCLYLECCCLDRQVWDWEVGYNWCQFLLCFSLKLPYGSSNPSNLLFPLCIMSLCVHLCVCICMCLCLWGSKVDKRCLPYSLLFESGDLALTSLARLASELWVTYTLVIPSWALTFARQACLCRHARLFP